MLYWKAKGSGTMKITGLQKMTLLDYPGKVACTVFLGGCNFRCPFCHNSQMLDGSAQPVMTEEELFAFLKKRQGLLDGVCVTGGEPTLQPGLPGFLEKIRALGYKVKLDTNGYRPEVLKAVVEQGLVDYVAMDIKNGPQMYAQTAGVELDIEKIEQSILYLVSDRVDYEFRTTVVEPLHSEQDILNMSRWLSELCGEKVPKRLFLQAFIHRETVCFDGLMTPSEDTLNHYKKLLVHAAKTVDLRGV